MPKPQPSSAAAQKPFRPVPELLRLNGVTLRRGVTEILREVSLTLSGGEKAGLVGRNGAGKTTLLELLAGRLQPSEGQLNRAPGLRMGYSAQDTARWRGTLWEVAVASLAHAQELEAELRHAETALASEEALTRYAELTTRFEQAGGYEAEATLKAHLERLGFGEDDYERDVPSLSGGERARLGLARTLTERPDLLLLDEPSLYLDLPAQRWLSETLKAFPGALLLASHDRALLDAVTTRTLHLSGGKLVSYRGNYSRFQQQQSHHTARALQDARRRAHERRSLTARIAAQPTLSTRRSLERRLARLPDAPEPVQSETNPTLTLMTTSLRPGSLVLEAQALSLTLGERTLLDDLSFRLHAGDKVALVGPNGSGKSSLLKLIAGVLEPDEVMPGEPEPGITFGKGVRVALFDQQERGLEDGVTLSESLSPLVSDGRARSLLALVGLSDAYDRTPETLSGGQRARAGIALLMATKANLLLLDEPSEGLDIGSIETLEAALQDTPAALLLVTHDAALADAVATRVLGLDGGKLREYRGGLAGYYAGTLRLEPDLPVLPDPLIDPKSPDPEAELEALEDESMAIDELLADPLRLSVRDRVRLERRRREITDLRSERYDARFPEPLPRFEVRESGIRLTTDGNTTPIVFANDSGVSLQLYLDTQTRVGHLVLLEAASACLLPWAETALVQGAVRLAFERLNVRAVQLQSAHDLRASGLEAAGEDWWVLEQARYAEREGLLRDSSPVAKSRRRGRRRKRKTSGVAV